MNNIRMILHLDKILYCYACVHGYSTMANYKLFNLFSLFKFFFLVTSTVHLPSTSAHGKACDTQPCLLPLYKFNSGYDDVVHIVEHHINGGFELNGRGGPDIEQEGPEFEVGSLERYEILARGQL